MTLNLNASDADNKLEPTGAELTPRVAPVAWGRLWFHWMALYYVAHGEHLDHLDFSRLLSRGTCVSLEKLYMDGAVGILVVHWYEGGMLTHGAAQLAAADLEAMTVEIGRRAYRLVRVPVAITPAVAVGRPAVVEAACRPALPWLCRLARLAIAGTVSTVPAADRYSLLDAFQNVREATLLVRGLLARLLRGGADVAPGRKRQRPADAAADDCPFPWESAEGESPAEDCVVCGEDAGLPGACHPVCAGCAIRSLVSKGGQACCPMCRSNYSDRIATCLQQVPVAPTQPFTWGHETVAIQETAVHRACARMQFVHQVTPLAGHPAGPALAGGDPRFTHLLQLAIYIGRGHLLQIENPASVIASVLATAPESNQELPRLQAVFVPNMALRVNVLGSAAGVQRYLLATRHLFSAGQLLRLYTDCNFLVVHPAVQAHWRDYVEPADAGRLEPAAAGLAVHKLARACELPAALVRASAACAAVVRRRVDRVCRDAVRRSAAASVDLSETTQPEPQPGTAQTASTDR